MSALYVASSAGGPMRSVDSITARAGEGLAGDRYARGAGHWQATDACQVTLITEDELRRAKRGQPAALRRALDEGHHRRNLVIGGLTAKAFEDKALRIGTAVFAYHSPRPPCGYLDQVEGRGLAGALGRHSGLCLRVVDGGRLSVGDRVELIDPR